MTIEQAIEHAERAYKESRNGLQYALKRGETKFAERCKKDAEEYGQLAELLRELQERRKAPEIITCGECEHFRQEPDGEMWCGVSKGHGIDKDFFCGDAERRTE